MYVCSRSSSLRLASHSARPAASMSENCTPSTPAAPPLLRTRRYAWSRMSSRYTLVVEQVEAERWLRLRLCIEPLPQGPDLFRGFKAHANPSTLSRFRGHPEVRPRSSTVISGFISTMRLSDSHMGHRLARRRQSRPAAQCGSPTLPSRPSPRAVPTTPARQRATRFGCSALHSGLLRYSGGSALASSLSRPAQDSLALRPAVSLTHPKWASPRASRIACLGRFRGAPRIPRVRLSLTRLLDLLRGALNNAG